MNESDVHRLGHMLRFASIAVSFVTGETRDSLDTDTKLMLALTKAVEIVGEAASQVSQETRLNTPQLPWRAMIGMRHILVHEYFAIDLDVLWVTASEHLPTLVTALEALMSDESDEA